MADVQLAEVKSLTQHGRFFKDKDTDRDMIEISFVGSKDTVVHNVKPHHMAQFHAEWNAYCDGRPMTRRAGTPLADVVGDVKAQTYIDRNIHNAEELAVLTDSQCQSLGHGTLTDRKNAQGLLMARKVEEATQQRDRVMSAAAEIGAPKETKSTEIAELGKKIDGMADAINSLVAALAPKKSGRPKRENNNAAG